MSIVLTQCPAGCPPCGTPCQAGVVPFPCTFAPDPTLGDCPVYTASTVTGSTATPLTTPLPQAGTLNLIGAAQILGPGLVDSSYNYPLFNTCWQSGEETGRGGPYPRAITIPKVGGGTYCQGTGTYSYSIPTGTYACTFDITVDVSSLPNWTAWHALSFAPQTFEIMEFTRSISCCCGWASCGPAPIGGTSWQYNVTCTYGWVFNSGTGLYDATLTATTQKSCE